MKLQTVFWKEGGMCVIKEAATWVTAQGPRIEDAMANVKEAAGLYLEEMPGAKESVRNKEVAGAVSKLPRPA